LLISKLQVYDRMGALVHQLTSGLTEVMLRDLQLTVLVRRRKCTTVEKVILMLQLPKLARDSGVVFLVCGHMHARLDDGPGEVVLQVE
jgi:hypothetical protein